MNKTKKGFGQEDDLGNYEGRWSQEECNNHTKRGVFVKFSYMYIGDLDYSDEQIYIMLPFVPTETRIVLMRRSSTPILALVGNTMTSRLL